ncbi:MAG TPA: hypothetical protein VF173_01055 [Thermoanaerobaculia bacterium]|nr:hypothetical protein [Thermoanaerobaculia bacterium]
MASETKDTFQRKAYRPNEARTPGFPTVAAERAAPEPVREKIAVFASHGMGQQIPFQTMDSIASGLLRAAGAKNTEIGTRTVKLGNPAITVQRIEFDADDAEGNPVEIHVYEGYWAPLTEGMVKGKEVVSFFLGGAWNGITEGKTFKRWFFGSYKEPHRAPNTSRTTWHLAMAALTLLSLVLFNAVIGAVAMGRLIKLVPSSHAWPNDELLGALTTVIAVFSLVALVYLGLLLLASFLKGKMPQSPPGWWKAYNRILWWLFFFFLYATVATAIAVVWLIVQDHYFSCPDEVHCPPEFAWVIPGLAGKWPIVWGLLFFVSGVVRAFVIQYVGDVAAYITPHKLDRFTELRTKIRQAVFDVAQAVYSDRDENGDLTYSRIGIIGHSLGSVVVYDVLNRLLVTDDLNDCALKVEERTRVLVTFGCPLDKAAYLFGLQGKQTTETREALAASLQPLILDYERFRTMKWVNVHAPFDIFSGALAFYDDDAAPGYTDERKVDNVVDPYADVPLVAHTEYWQGTTIYSHLYQGLSTPKPGGPSGPGKIVLP